MIVKHEFRGGDYVNILKPQTRTVGRQKQETVIRRIPGKIHSVTSDGAWVVHYSTCWNCRTPKGKLPKERTLISIDALEHRNPVANDPLEF